MLFLLWFLTLLTLIAKIAEKLKLYIEELDEVKIKAGLKTLMAASSLCNAYFQQNKPWDLAKSPDTMERCGTVVNIGCNAVVALATMAEPYMPGLTKKILAQLKLDRSALDLKDADFHFVLKAGHEIGEPEPLFQAISAEQVDEWRSKFGGSQDLKEFPLHIVSGQIESVAQHETADHLYVLQVNVGDAHRQIVSGLKADYTIDELIGRSVAVLANLKPGNFRGVRSNGMILCGVQDDKIGLLQPSSAPGTEIAPEGYEVIKSRIDANKGLKPLLPDLKSNENGDALFKGQVLLSDGKPVHVHRLSGVCQIK